MKMPTKFHLDGGAIVYVGEPLGKSNFKNMMFHIVGIHRKSKARKLSKKLGIAIHKDSKRRNKERWNNKVKAKEESKIDWNEIIRQWLEDEDEISNIAKESADKISKAREKVRAKGMQKQNIKEDDKP